MKVIDKFYDIKKGIGVSVPLHALKGSVDALCLSSYFLPSH